MLDPALETDSKPASKLEKINRVFNRVTSELFGEGGVAVVVTRQTVLVYFGLTLFLAVLLTLRRVDAVATPQFWAEDGTLIFRNSVLLNSWDFLSTSVYGFPYLLPKLIGLFARPFGFEAAPLVYSLAANVFVALLIATFSLPHFKHLVKSDILRIVFCIVVVCLPNSDELIGAAINIGWYIGIWAVLTAFMILPRSRVGLIGLALVHVICLYSSPSAIIIAPIWFVRLLRGFLRRDKAEWTFALVILATIGSLFLVTGDFGSNLDQSKAAFSVVAMLNFLVTRVISELIVGNFGILVLDGLFGPFIGYIVTLLGLVGLFYLLRVARYKGALISLAFGGVILSSMILTFVGRKSLNETGAVLGDVFIAGSGRYFLLGNAIFFLVILFSLDRLPLSRLKVTLVSVVLGVILLALSQSFLLPVRPDTHWPQYARQIPAALDPTTHQPLVIPIQPVDPPWYIRFNTDLTLARPVALP
ncbi:MAG: hypothetical protein J0I20_03640 [Chloroflexi bacterium]|nr:hypothetical protein [Chloroflexota bacterium]OJV89164.1 MAG: hypothetical protein BGO39_34710 [Chloroflexi bacterium 54-19]